MARENYHERVTPFRAALVLALLSCFVSCGGGDGGARDGRIAARVRVSVDASAPGRPISGRLFGANALWIDGGQGLVRRRRLEPDPATVAAVRALGVGLLRFPGGTQSHRYHFMDGIGRLEDRRPGVDVFSGRTVESDYGLDEFMKVTGEIGAEPIIVTNRAEGSPQESAAFVAYANARVSDDAPIGKDENGRDFGTSGDWARRRAANGRAEPYGVRLVEIGNETNLERYGERASDYALAFRAHAEAIRRVDPDVRLFAPGFLDPAEPGLKDRAAKAGVSWNETIVREAGGLLDGLAIHFYPAERGDSDGCARLLAEPARLERGLAALSSWGKSARGPDLPPLLLAITEYGTFFRAEGEGFTSENASQLTALFEAGVVMAAARAGIEAACLHALLLEAPDDPRLAGGVHFAMLRREKDGRLARAPIALVFAELSAALRGRALLRTSVPGTVFHTESGAVAALDALAAEDAASGEVRVVLVPRAARGVTEVEIECLGLAVASAEAVLVAADSLAATRVEGDDPPVRRGTRALAVGSEGRVALRLDAGTFAVVRLRPRPR